MKPISISAVVGARTKSALTRVGSLGLALCLVSTPTYASEFSIPANTGYAFDRPKCFERSGSSITNVCRTITGELYGDYWIIPLITPFTGHHYRVTVRAKAGRGELLATSCSVFAFNNQGDPYDVLGDTPSVFATQRNTFQALVLTAVICTSSCEATEDIPVYGSDDPDNGGPATLQVNCSVQRDGGALLSVELVNLD
jgi:hypothetical protein